MSMNRLLSAIFFSALALPCLLFARPDLPDCELPAPDSIKATLNATSVGLSWDGVPGAYGYQVRIYALPDGELVSELEKIDTAAQIDNLEPGGSYRCVISTLCQSGIAATHENTIIIDIVLNNSSPADESPVTPTEGPAATAVAASWVQNPFSDLLSLFIPAAESAPARIRLLSAGGQLVFDQTLPDGAGPWIELAVESLDAGLYWVRIETGAGVQTLRAVKM